MVMDATQPQQPSPQSVGREFVRQYYTLLNKAPNHLHRFYNNNSSFIHGESTLVVGQKNIHNRIQQLNFHDCHAKISQVDAQATLGNGVVVQVTGELSNDGQPMRRFTQTFVLAAQSPKKYYVHNDIFRYQDMYSDEENEGDVRSENGDDLEHPAQSGNIGGGDQPSQLGCALAADTPNQLSTQMVTTPSVLPQQQNPQQTTAPQQHAIYYSMPTAGVRPVPVLATPQGAPVPLGTPFSSTATASIAPQQIQTANLSQLNGVVAHDDLIPGIQQPPAAAVGGSPVGQASAPVALVSGAVSGSTPLTTIPQNASAVVTNFQQQSPLMQQSVQQHPIPQSASVSTMHSQGSQIASATTSVDFEENCNVATISVNNENVAQVVPTDTATIENTMPATPIVEDFKTINEQQLQEKYEASKQQQNEPKTYANLFKSTSTSPSSFVNAALQQQQQVQQQQQQQQQQTSNNGFQPTTTIPSATFTQSNSSSMSTYIRNSNNSIDNNSNVSTQGGPLPQRTPSARVSKDYEQRRISNAQQFGDNQQLFLGNIPHHASEEELKTLFARFGTIVELRILSKPGGKLPPGVRNPLNYGFITYEDPESVQNCLGACPLYFPENSPDGQKLNVEEKKPRIRSDLPPRQSMGNNMNSGSGMSGQRNMSGGPQSRSLSNSGSGSSNSGMMRGNGAGNNMSRGGSSSGQRIGGGFNRNDNRTGSQSNGGGGPQLRGGNNNTQPTGGSSYAGRR